MAYTIEQRVAEFGAAVRARLGPFFERAGVAYPPGWLALLAFKDRRVLEVYAGTAAAASARDTGAAGQGTWHWVRDYAILGASGGPGPKLREGDRQVPEGLYAVESLNPNSRFHVALRVNYPNAADREHARRDGREHPGSDIMIHGGSASIGCLAMGDAAAEDLFVLTALTGRERVRLVFAPTDFRANPEYRAVSGGPMWLEALYGQLRAELRAFPLRPKA